MQRYDLLDVIGHGSTGVVRLAYDRLAERYVAAKVLPRHAVDERIPVRHDCVVETLDWYRTADHSVLIMALAGAGTVADLAGRRLSASAVMTIAADALSGLSALHAAGFVHRDVKPANLLLRRDRDRVRAVIGDLGLAVSPERGVVGTLGFVAPEVAAGEPDSPRSDLWSLGRTLGAWGFDFGWLSAEDPADRPQSAADALAVLGCGSAIPVGSWRVPDAVRAHQTGRDVADVERIAALRAHDDCGHVVVAGGVVQHQR